MDKFSHRPLGDAPRRRPRVGQPLSADRLQADQRHPGPGNAQLRLDRRQGTRPAPAWPARLHRRAATPRAARRRAISASRTIRSPSAAIRTPTNFSVRNLTLPNGISMTRLENRRRLLQIDRHAPPRRRPDRPDGRLRRLHPQGVRDGRPARPPSRPSTSTRKTPDRAISTAATTSGQSMLLARRLVEAGVTFVTVNAGGWDTHANNFEALKNRKLPEFDTAWAALMQDMHTRGLLQNTLVLVWGEFGRTPRINKDAGRDHWPGAMSVVLAGGGLKMGQAIGVIRRPGRVSQGTPDHRRKTCCRRCTASWASTRTASIHNEAQRPLKILNQRRADPGVGGMIRTRCRVFCVQNKMRHALTMTSFQFRCKEEALLRLPRLEQPPLSTGLPLPCFEFCGHPV